MQFSLHLIGRKNFIGTVGNTCVILASFCPFFQPRVFSCLSDLPVLRFWTVLVSLTVRSIVLGLLPVIKRSLCCVLTDAAWIIPQVAHLAPNCFGLVNLWLIHDICQIKQTCLNQHSFAIIHLFVFSQMRLDADFRVIRHAVSTYKLPLKIMEPLFRRDRYVLWLIMTNLDETAVQ